MNRAEADLIARRTIARYAAAIDHKDFDAVAAIFSEDSELRRVGIVTEGRDAIARFYSEHLPTVGQMRHHMTNILAEPEGNLIVVIKSFDKVVWYGSVKSQFMSHGVYPRAARLAHAKALLHCCLQNPPGVPSQVRGAILGLAALCATH